MCSVSERGNVSCLASVSVCGTDRARLERRRCTLLVLPYAQFVIRFERRQDWLPISVSCCYSLSFSLFPSLSALLHLLVTSVTTFPPNGCKLRVAVQSPRHLRLSISFCLSSPLHCINNNKHCQLLVEMTRARIPM